MYICQCESRSHHHKGKCKDPVDSPGYGSICDQCRNWEKEHETRRFNDLKDSQSE